jgi:hypothetical protein
MRVITVLLFLFIFSSMIDLFLLNRIVRKLQFLNNSLIKRHFFRALARKDARLVRQSTGLPHKSNILLKHKVIIILYIVLSYLLCDLITIIITEQYYPPLVKQFGNYLYMLVDFMTSGFLAVLFFGIFLLIKIFPCIFVIKNTPVPPG